MGIYLGKRIGKGVFVGMRGKDAANGLLILIVVMLVVGVAAFSLLMSLIRTIWPLLLIIVAGWIGWALYSASQKTKHPQAEP
jgi:hypothetical protein